VDRQATQAASSPLPHRIHKSLLLAACADTVAAPLHGTRLPNATDIDAAIAASPTPVALSYHAEHLLLLAGHLATHDGGLDEAKLAWTLAQSRMHTDSNDTSRVLSQVAQGIPWWRAAPSLHNGQGSYGSSAAVRACAAGLLPHQGLGAIAEIARRSAVTTHTHPWARDGAAITATATALACRGLPGHNFTTDRVLATIASQAHDPETAHYLSVTRTLVRHRAGPAETIATLNSTASVLRTVPAALTAYLRHPHDPTAAIRYALALGGHTRAISIITAALAGARNPQHQPPATWRAASYALRIHPIANALAALKNSHPQPWRNT
jgi:poly(ADP-ribose) glycohydrolase ARH3